MNAADRLFLQCVRAGLHPDEPVEPELSQAAFPRVFTLGKQHQLTGLVLDTLMKAHQPLPPEQVSEARSAAVNAAIRQQIQENELLDLLLALYAEGIEPLLVKGAVCRNLYPQPLLRPSVDEDLYLPRAQAEKAHSLLCSHGLTPDKPEATVETDFELSYHRPNSPTYLELHFSLLDPDSPVFGPCNVFFQDSFSHPSTVQIQDVEVRTLCPTEHVLFLLLHAYKHFLHSGFGIRLIADLCLFTARYADEIDHAHVFEACRQLRCEAFAAACYKIGSVWLGFEVPAIWQKETVDELPLLEDILESGLHGAESLDRLHSSTITLQTVANERTGKRSGGLRGSLFPSANQLSGRYRYLQKAPFLLPVAWVQRGFRYLTELLRKPERRSNPVASIQIGESRRRLLETYHII